MSFSVTRITAKSPSTLSKGYRLSPGGDLEPVPGQAGRLFEGTAHAFKLETLSDFAEILPTLTPAQALAYGVFGREQANVTTRKNLNLRPGGWISRTRDFFSFPTGPGIFLFDYAPRDGRAPLTPKEWLEKLHAAWPELASAPAILWHSASSYIFDGKRMLRGRRGLRLYVLVTDVADVERAGGVLFKRLWIRGEGYIKVSKGDHPRKLERSIIDAAVWQPERLDFAGGAALAKPLHQARPAPVVINPEAAPIDTRVTLPDLEPYDEVRLGWAHSAALHEISKLHPQEQDYV